jgi:RNA polymerase sigma factor (sigma-70 family)
MELTKQAFEFFKEKAYHIARHLGPSYPTDDLVGYGLLSLAKSLKSYRKNPNMTFESYAIQHMKWDMTDAIRVMRLENRWDAKKNGASYVEVDMDEPSVARLLIVPPPEKTTDLVDLERAISKLPKKTKSFVLAYLKTDSIAVASAAIGVNTQAGYNLHWNAVRLLRNAISRNLGFRAAPEK